jgi:hypothetical protein
MKLMAKKALFALLSLVILIVLVSCGERDGSNPLGVTGGGSKGYGSQGNAGIESDGFVSDSQKLVGTWRNNLDSLHYLMFRFADNGVCEIWDNLSDDPLHALGYYTVQSHINTNSVVQISVHSALDLVTPFYFLSDDLIFEEFGPNRLFHRVG